MSIFSIGVIMGKMDKETIEFANMHSIFSKSNYWLMIAKLL